MVIVEQAHDIIRRNAMAASLREDASHPSRSKRNGKSGFSMRDETYIPGAQ
jgi:hypothetical protein